MTPFSRYSFSVGTLISTLVIYLSTTTTKSFVDAAFIPTYPWGGSLSQRSNEILEAMRDDLSYSMDETLFPSPMRANPTATALVFNNIFGEEYACIQETPASDIPMHLYDSELLSHLLQNICSDLTIEYW
jgi:hypothetical protein